MGGEIHEPGGRALLTPQETSQEPSIQVRLVTGWIARETTAQSLTHFAQDPAHQQLLTTEEEPLA